MCKINRYGQFKSLKLTNNQQSTNKNTKFKKMYKTNLQINVNLTDY